MPEPAAGIAPASFNVAVAAGGAVTAERDEVVVHVIATLRARDEMVAAQSKPAARPPSAESAPPLAA